MLFVVFAAVFAVAQAAHEFRVINHCSHTVWVGTLGNSGKPAPDNGGFQLNSGQRKSVYVPNEWGGRFWGRTHCDGNMNCQTGFCGNNVQCNGAGGRPPCTLAEFTMDGWPPENRQDYYDVSLVDGYNLPVKIVPING